MTETKMQTDTTPTPTPVDRRTLLREVLDVWAPTWPRRIGKTQHWGQTPDAAVSLIEAIPRGKPGYISVYGFPDGHVKDGKIPAIDCLFIDLDIPAEGRYGRPNGASDADQSAWFADMTDFLTVVRAVARTLIETDKDRFVRASLSGHKGIHLYLDFPVLRDDLGDITQYKKGLSEYGAAMVSMLEEGAGVDLSPYVDVDSSDLARLTRLPNTLHETATRNFSEPRYCVPVSVEELARLTPIDYVLLTRTPRPLPEECRRVESLQDAELAGRYIMVSPPGNAVSSSPRSVGSYQKTADESLTLYGRYNSVESYLRQRRPFMWAFRERNDCFNHGAASHFFEFAIIQELVLQRAPIDVIVEFFADCPGFDEGWTRSQVHRVISWGKSNSVSDEKLRENAPMFMPKE